MAAGRSGVVGASVSVARWHDPRLQAHQDIARRGSRHRGTGSEGESPAPFHRGAAPARSLGATPATRCTCAFASRQPTPLPLQVKALFYKEQSTLPCRRPFSNAWTAEAVAEELVLDAVDGVPRAASLLGLAVPADDCDEGRDEWTARRVDNLARIRSNRVLLDAVTA